MNFLLDTHVWLWRLTSSSRLGPQTRELLDDAQNELYLSATSSWEIAIKWRLGKLHLPARPQELVAESFRVSQLRPLPISHEHALAVADLPDHHHDPFDRLLIAQAIHNNLVLITADDAVKQYPVPIHWAER